MIALIGTPPPFSTSGSRAGSLRIGVLNRLVRSARFSFDFGVHALPGRSLEGGGHIMFFSFRGFHAEDQHMLGEPALFARQIRAYTQSKTFLAQQNVTAVTGTDGNDRVVLWKMTDESALRIDVQQRMHAAV